MGRHWHHHHKQKFMLCFEEDKGQGRELFLHLLILNCLQLKIILMPKWHNLGGIVWTMPSYWLQHLTFSTNIRSLEERVTGDAGVVGNTGACVPLSNVTLIFWSTLALPVGKVESYKYCVIHFPPAFTRTTSAPPHVFPQAWPWRGAGRAVRHLICAILDFRRESHVILVIHG